MAALVLKATRPLVGVGRDRPHDEDATRPLATFGKLACEPRKLIGAPRRAQVAWRHYDHQQARSFNLLAEFVGQRGGRIKAAIVPDRQLIELGKQASDIGLETIDHALRPASQRRIVDAGDMTMGVAHEHVIVEVRCQIRHWLHLLPRTMASRHRATLRPACGCILSYWIIRFLTLSMR